MDDKEELQALRRMAELEAKAGGATSKIAPPAFEGYGSLLDKAAYRIGGGATDMLAGKVPPEVAGGAGWLANVATQAIPTILGGYAGSMAEKPAQAMGRSLMKSAIKPSVAHKAKAPAAIETMLKGGYSPTNAGMEAMRDKMASLVSQADDVIAPSKKAIDLSRALQNVSGVADKARAGTIGVREADTALDVSRQLLAHPAVDDLGTMSVQAAQAMKQANYKSMGDAAYGMGLKPAAERDALKAATAGLKTNIERAEPAVAPINAQISELVNALKVSSRRAAMEGNKDIVPLGASVATALHNPVAALGLYANSSAAVKAMLARMLYTGGGATGTATGATLGAALGAESGRAP